jgi:hypothetical protein
MAAAVRNFELKPQIARPKLEFHGVQCEQPFRGKFLGGMIVTVEVRPKVPSRYQWQVFSPQHRERNALNSR